jgi:hypothetical protein
MCFHFLAFQLDVGVCISFSYLFGQLALASLRRSNEVHCVIDFERFLLI